MRIVFSNRIDFLGLGVGDLTKVRLLSCFPIDHIYRAFEEPLKVHLQPKLLVKEISSLSPLPRVVGLVNSIAHALPIG